MCMHAFAEPEAFEAVMADLDRVVLPGVTHWQSPHFFAYFPCNASFPAMLGDMVSGMINCVGFNWVQTDRQTDR
jgi:aromatic-L-amino-acid/L-tryptophan decarboxylase